MHVTEIPLTQEAVARIQAWLRTTESIEFRKVLAALHAKEECDALVALNQSEGDDGHRQEALDKIEMANRYKFMLHVIDSAALGHDPDSPGAKFPFVTIKVEQSSGSEKLLEKLNSTK